MYGLRMLSVALLIIGGLNWGLVGLANFNLVEAIFGQLSRLIYIVVGLAALMEIVGLATAGEPAGTLRRDRT